MQQYASKFVILVSFIFSFTAAHSQDLGLEVYTDSHGIAFYKKTLEDIDGDPYVFKNWLPGVVETTDGKRFDKLKLKYDAYTNNLLFIYDENDEPQLFKDNIRTFTLMSTTQIVFANGFPATGDFTPKSYYQVLSKGKVTLLKHYQKIIHEKTEYNNPVIFKNFQDVNGYYIYSNNSVAPLKRNKEAILELFADKKEAVSSYINSNAINIKDDAALVKVFNYYNTL